MFTKRKKRWTGFTMLVALAMLVAACDVTGPPDNGSGQTGAPAAAEDETNTQNNGEKKERVRLRLSHLFTGTDVRAGIYNPRLEQFKKLHPEIDLQVISTSSAMNGADYQKQIQVDLAANNLSDLFLFWSGGRTGFLLDSNSVSDLTDFVQNDPDMKDRFFSDSFNGNVRDGRHYGVPAEYAYVVTFANRELFEKVGLEYPKTFDELKNAVKIFNENDIIPISYSGKNGSEMSLIYDMILQNLLDTAALEKSVSGTQGIDPLFENAAEYMKQLNDLKAFPESAVVIPNEQALALFTNGKAAMYIMGSWRVGGFGDEIERKVDVIPFPGFPESTGNIDERMLSFPGQTYFIKAKTTEPAKVEAAKALIKYMTQDDFAELIIKETAGPMPNRKVAPDPAEISPVLRQIFEMKAQRPDGRGRIGFYLNPAAATEFHNLLAALMQSQKTPKQFYDELNKVMQAHQE
jgi:raffinose/stachyose/melibiose transport system substrate-binding protein